MFCGWCDGGTHGSNIAQAKTLLHFDSCNENTLHFVLNYILSFPFPFFPFHFYTELPLL